MSIPAHCDACGKKFMVPERLAGRTLPCKECGEPLPVDGAHLDGDSEARPRGAPGRRGASRSGRRTAVAKPRRRRKSGVSIPRWIPLVVAGAVGVAAIIVAAVLLVPTLSASHESLQRDAIAEMNDVGETLEGVQDEAAARAAIADLQASGARLFEIYRKVEEMRKTDPLTEQEEDALRKSLQRDRIRALDRVNVQTRRITDDPRLAAILREPISQFVGRVHDGEKERRRRDVDKWVQQVEENRARAREAVEQRLAAQQQAQQANGSAGAPTGVPAAGQMPAHVPGAGPPGQPPHGFPGPRAYRPGGRPPFGPPAAGPDTLTVEMPRPGNFGDVRSRLREIAGRTNRFGTSTVNGQLTVTISPVADVQQFADLIDFGQVTEVDAAARRIVVAPDDAYRFRPDAAASIQPAADEQKITVAPTFVHERFGMTRIAALALRGLTDDTPQELVKARIDDARQAIGETEPIITSWQGSGSSAMLVVGPVTDLEAFAAALDIGAIAVRDPAQRLLVIDLDAAKLRPEPKRVAELQLSTNRWPGDGPHGGKVVALNGGEFHVELWMDAKTGNLVVWLSDRSRQPVAVRGNSLTVNIKRPGADLPLRVHRAPHPDDPADASSRFLGNIPEVEAARQRGIPVHLLVPLGGKTHTIEL